MIEMKKPVKVAVVQMQCVMKDVDATLEHAEKMVREAAVGKPDLIVLPELFNTGYRVEEADSELAELPGGRTEKWMQALAAELNAYLIGAILERDGEIIYDTALLVGPEGRIGHYRKMYLWGAETERFGRGDDVAVFELPFAKVGLQICYEIGFPEGTRKLAQNGAEIVVYTSAFGKIRGYAWDLFSKARALENGIYTVACNRVGTEKDTVFGGLSRIVAPNTMILAGADTDSECVISAAFDLDAIEEQRNQIPYLRDLEIKKFPY